MDPFCFFSLFHLGPCIRQLVICTIDSKSSPVIGRLAEMLQAPRLCPCERRNVPATDAAAYTAATIAGMAGVAVAAPPTGAIIFGVDAVAAAAGVAAAVNTSDFDRPEGGRWCRGIAFRYSPGSGSCFCHWRLACCGWDGPQPGHVEVELAVQVCRPPSSLSYAPSPLTPSPAVDSPSSAIGGNCCWGGEGAGKTCYK